MAQALRVARYRLPSTLRRGRGAYLGIVLLIGLIGGIAMASIAAGRLTQSSYPRFLASTNPSDMTVSVFDQGGTAPSLVAPIERLPGIKHVGTGVGPDVVPLTARDAAGEGTGLARRPRQHRRPVRSSGHAGGAAGPNVRPGPDERGRVERQC